VCKARAAQADKFRTYSAEIRWSPQAQNNEAESSVDFDRKKTNLKISMTTATTHSSHEAHEETRHESFHFLYPSVE
jgi:hypothetical protein